MTSNALLLSVKWAGPFAWEEVIQRFDDGGRSPSYAGPDYGLYQIYGNHILSGPETLLYIGRATQQTFSARFLGHRGWLEKEGPEILKVYLGRINDPARHSDDGCWATWVRDVEIAECLLIYKYSPNYNSMSIAEPPSLAPYQSVTIEHEGKRCRLSKKDVAPDDWW